MGRKYGKLPLNGSAESAYRVSQNAPLSDLPEEEKPYEVKDLVGDTWKIQRPASAIIYGEDGESLLIPVSCPTCMKNTEGSVPVISWGRKCPDCGFLHA